MLGAGSMKARVRASTPPGSGYAPSVSSDGARAAVYAETGSWVVDVKTGATVSKLEGRTYARNEISPDGAYLLEPSGRGAVLRSADDGKVLLRFGEQPPASPPEDPPPDEAPPYEL